MKVHTTKPKDKSTVLNAESIDKGTAKVTNMILIEKELSFDHKPEKLQLYENVCKHTIEDTSTVGLSVKTVESIVCETHNTCDSKNITSCGQVEITLKDGVLS